MENSSITVTLKRLSGKVVRSDWQCQNGRELLRELERLDTLMIGRQKFEQLRELGGAQGFKHPQEFVFGGWKLKAGFWAVTKVEVSLWRMMSSVKVWTQNILASFLRLRSIFERAEKGMVPASGVPHSGPILFHWQQGSHGSTFQLALQRFPSGGGRDSSSPTGATRGLWSRSGKGCGTNSQWGFHPVFPLNYISHTYIHL